MSIHNIRHPLFERQDEINVMIEIAADSGPIKYEFDEKTGYLCVDRFMQTSMSYPCNYGFMPNTQGGDGDPLDVLVYTRYPILPGSLISCRFIGVLITEDENGSDAKIFAIPGNKIDPSLSHIKTCQDLGQVFLDKVSHFFARYKDLEKGKWVKVQGWQNADEARKIIQQALKFENKIEDANISEVEKLFNSIQEV